MTGPAKDFGYVNIMYRYGGKQSCPRPDQCEKMEVMWADESVYGPPAPGSKVGDFIQTWLMGSWNCGVFTHREIAQRLMDTFTGLKVKELAWFENPREKTLKNGKPRVRRAKWLPEREVEIWCTLGTPMTTILTRRNPTPAETDFFTVTRMDAWGVSTWFMSAYLPRGRRKTNRHGLRQSGQKKKVQETVYQDAAERFGDKEQWSDWHDRDR